MTDDHRSCKPLEKLIDEIPGRELLLCDNPHPDWQLLNDWALYGPKDPIIEHLVRRLALEHGFRLVEIEALIAQALEHQIKKQGLAD